MFRLRIQLRLQFRRRRAAQIHRQNNAMDSEFRIQNSEFRIGNSRDWKTKKNVWLIWLLASGFCLLNTSCAPREPRADITIINQAEPETLDPALLTGIPEMRIAVGMFEGLTRLDPKTAAAIPGLAQNWEISPDGKIYTFHLRTNLVWSTGEPIYADDVVYSFIRTLNPATASDYAGQLFYIKNAEDFNAGKIKDASLVGIHAPDPFTVRVELKNPTAFFLDIC